MTLQKQIRFWLISLFVLIFCLWLFSDILLPFIAGMILAHFLDPIADWLEEKGASRLLATVLILGISLLLLTLLLLLLVPVLIDQVSNFITNLPDNIKALQALFNEMAPTWLKQALATQTSELSGNAGEITTKIAGWAGTVITSLLSGGIALVNIVSLMIVTPIVAFYLLLDWDRMIAKIDGWLPRDYRDQIREIATDINNVMAGFIRGQGTVCMILGIFYAITLIGVGLKFGLLIGLAAGFLSFIPYVGSIIGGVLSIGMALIQFWPDWTLILIVVAIFVVGQFMEGNFLSPNLVGGSIGLHPVWLMFALFAFGYLFGFVGLLLAVPMAAILGVLTRFALKQYLSSRLYLGSNPPKVDEVAEVDQESDTAELVKSES